jgi:hypothetical protein
LAEPNVGLMAGTVSTRAGGDRFLTLQSCIRATAHPLHAVNVWNRAGYLS